MRLVDRACFHLLTVLYDTFTAINNGAKRELCARQAHEPVELGTAYHPDGTVYLLMACERDTCTWTATVDIHPVA